MLLPAMEQEPSQLLQQATHTARQGWRLNREQASELFESAPLALLSELAQAARQQAVPGKQVSYLIDRNINYTNVCNTDCTFCGFYRPNNAHPEAYVLSRETIAQKIEEALEQGATRILLQGGHNDQLPFSFYVELVAWMRQNFPIELNCFSPSEIEQMHKVSGKSHLEILQELKAAGMHGLPGGGAEILDNAVRARVSPKKISADLWIEIMGIAQELELTTTATMVIGLGETLAQRFNHLDRVRALQDRSIAKGFEGFNAFISWPLQHNQQTSMGRSRHAERYGASATEYLRHTAVSRLYLDRIPHHQASWPTLGADVAEIALQFGCDDIGSTMMEENVVSQAGAPTKQRWSMTAGELRQHIVNAGYEPRQRTSGFKYLEEAVPGLDKVA
jgi:cyclic dehypoxanthinyl futalosine synthase